MLLSRTVKVTKWFLRIQSKIRLQALDPQLIVVFRDNGASVGMLVMQMAVIRPVERARDDAILERACHAWATNPIFCFDGFHRLPFCVFFPFRAKMAIPLTFSPGTQRPIYTLAGVFQLVSLNVTKAGSLWSELQAAEAAVKALSGTLGVRNPNCALYKEVVGLVRSSIYSDNWLIHACSVMKNVAVATSQRPIFRTESSCSVYTIFRRLLAAVAGVLHGNSKALHPSLLFSAVTARKLMVHSVYRCTTLLGLILHGYNLPLIFGDKCSLQYVVR